MHLQTTKHFYIIHTVEPPIVVLPRQGCSILDLYTKDAARGPKNIYFPNKLRIDNLSTKDK